MTSGEKCNYELGDRERESFALSSQVRQYIRSRDLYLICPECGKHEKASYLGLIRCSPAAS